MEKSLNSRIDKQKGTQSLVKRKLWWIRSTQLQWSTHKEPYAKSFSALVNASQYIRSIRYPNSTGSQLTQGIGRN